MEGIIYKIENIINNKVYIGQTIQTLKYRWNRHCQKTSISEAESNMKIKKALLKYGKENFIISELERCSIELLNEKEKFYIQLYNSYNLGYNGTLGGQDGSKPLQTPKDIQKNIIKMYIKGNSLRVIATFFNKDKNTIKLILERNNIPIRTTRTYKLSQEVRIALISDYNKGIKRKDIILKYKISKSYLSQLINNKRRI